MKKLTIVMIFFTVAAFLGCTQQSSTYSTPLSPLEIQRGAVCNQYAHSASDYGVAYSSCLSNLSSPKPKPSQIISDLNPSQLCALPKPDTAITDAINISMKKRHIDCVKIARDNQIQLIKTSSNPELCQSWSNRTGGDLQPVIDAEVKKRGVQCELVLGQIQ